MWPDAEATQNMVDEARRGEAGAIDRLLQTHREALKRLIAMRLDRRLSRRVDASDIVQDVLVEANRRLPVYLRESGMPFGLWLRYLARDRVIDAHRRHRGALRRSMDREQPLMVWQPDRSTLDLAAELKDRELTPASAASWHELEARFHDAVERLDAQDREIVQLRHVEQLSNQECAATLGLSFAAAGMRYLRAMRRLRVLLAEYPSQAEA